MATKKRSDEILNICYYQGKPVITHINNKEGYACGLTYAGLFHKPTETQSAQQLIEEVSEW